MRYLTCLVAFLAWGCALARENFPRKIGIFSSIVVAVLLVELGLVVTPDAATASGTAPPWAPLNEIPIFQIFVKIFVSLIMLIVAPVVSKNLGDAIKDKFSNKPITQFCLCLLSYSIIVSSSFGLVWLFMDSLVWAIILSIIIALFSLVIF